MSLIKSNIRNNIFQLNFSYRWYYWHIAKTSALCFNTKQCCLVKSLITVVGWFVEDV
jgi:hypothetical protein